MSKVMLPYVEPIYSTYNFLSVGGIPAKQNKTSDNWYYNNTIAWRCTRKFLHGFTTPEIWLCSGELWSIPFLEISEISMRFARRSVLDIIKTMIDDGFYVVFTGVDDFYIKGKSWYQEQHFYHDGIILGYDEEHKSFVMAAYDQRWIFAVFETPQSCFVEGMRAFCDKGIYGELYAVKAKEDIQRLDLNLIKNQLNEYLSSNIYAFPLDNTDDVRGIAVYDYICMYLDKLADGSIPHNKRDRRIFRLIWEHKKCMFERIKAVEDACGWNNELSEAYKEIVKLSDTARFIYSKFVIKYSNSHLEKIQIILMNMKELELDLLSQFLKQLEKDQIYCNDISSNC